MPVCCETGTYCPPCGAQRRPSVGHVCNRAVAHRLKELCKFSTTSSSLTCASEQPSLSTLPVPWLPGGVWKEPMFFIFSSHVCKVSYPTFRNSCSGLVVQFRGQTQGEHPSATRVENKSILLLTTQLRTFSLTNCKSTELSMAIQSIWTLFCTALFHSSSIQSAKKLNMD